MAYTRYSIYAVVRKNLFLFLKRSACYAQLISNTVRYICSPLQQKHPELISSNTQPGAYLPLGHAPPLWTAKKIFRLWQEMQPKCAILRQKSQKFSAEGHSHLPRPYPHWGGKYPWPDRSPSAPQPSTPSKFFPNFYHYARLRCCYWRIWEIESSASFVSRPRPIKWNALEVGPVNIQSSHWINLLMQFVMDWRTPANSIINIT